MTDEWNGWRTLLAGNAIDTDPNEPFTGYYRMRRGKGGRLVPVAYWRVDGALMCMVDGRQIDELRAVEIWPYCVKQPIPHDWYLAVTERGEPWPDMDAAVHEQIAPGRGHNQGPSDEAEILREQIEAAKASVGDYQTISDDATAARAQSLRSRLLELARTADKTREAAKKPHLDASKAVDAKWQPLVKMAKEAADMVARAMSAFETEKLRREREEQRKAEEAARKAAASGKPVPIAPVPSAVPATPIKGAYGRAAAVKLVKVAAVVDQDKAYAFFRTSPEMIALIQKLSQRAVDAGQDVPGVVAEEQRKVS